MHEHAATGLQVAQATRARRPALVGAGPLRGAARREAHQRATLTAAAAALAGGAVLAARGLAGTDGDALTTAPGAAAAVFILGCLIAVWRLGEATAITRFTGLPGRLLCLWAGTAIAAWMALLTGKAAGAGTGPDGLLAASALFPLAWVVVRPVVNRPFTRVRRAVIVGSGDAAERLTGSIARSGPRWEIRGWLDDDCGVEAPGRLGRLEDLPAVVAREGIETVILAFSPRRDEELVEVIRACDGLGAEILMLPRLFELMDAGDGLSRAGAFGLMRIAPMGPRRPQLAVKRVLDIAGAAAGLLLLAPALLAVAVLILLDDGGPVFFRQRRVGRHGVRFGMLKFRTMRRDAEEQERALMARLLEGGVAPADAVDELKRAAGARVTRVGRFLRATSLDELPQLWNVILGDMSLVGPRPLPLSEAPAVEGWQHHRHDLRPGITGLWQVLGRSNTPWQERMRLDYLYVRNWSLTDDLRILVRTVITVAARDGAR